MISRGAFLWGISAIALASAALRGFAAVHVPAVETTEMPPGWRWALNSDAPGYVAGAANLLRHGRIASTPDGPADARREPLFIAYLAGVTVLFGRPVEAVGEADLRAAARAARTVHILLAALSAAILVLLAREILGDDLAALWAGLLWAAYGPAVYLSVEILRESITAPLLVAGFASLVIGRRRGRTVLVAAGVFALALVVLARADGLIAVAFGAVFLGATAPAGRRLRAVAVPVAVAAIGPLLWALRNLHVVGQFVYVVHAGPVAWFSLCLPADAYYTVGEPTYARLVDRVGHAEAQRILATEARRCLVERPFSFHLSNAAERARQYFDAYFPRRGIWPWLLGAAVLAGVGHGLVGRAYHPLPFALAAAVAAGAVGLSGGVPPPYNVDALFVRDHDLLLAALVGLAISPPRDSATRAFVGLYLGMALMASALVPLFRLRAAHDWIPAIWAAAALRFGPARLADLLRGRRV